MPVIDLTAHASKRARHALRTIASLIERDTRLYLTAREWSMLLNELVENAMFEEKSMIARTRWRQEQDKRGCLEWGGTPQTDGGRTPILYVVNAGTDDQAIVNAKNSDEPGAIDFQAKKNSLQKGRPADTEIKRWFDEAKQTTALSTTLNTPRIIANDY